MTIVLKNLLSSLFFLICLISSGTAMQQAVMPALLAKPSVPMLKLASVARPQSNASGSGGSHTAREAGGSSQRTVGDAQWGPATARRHHAQQSGAGPAAGRAASVSKPEDELGIAALLVGMHELRLGAAARVAGGATKTGRIPPPPQEIAAELKGWHCYVHNERAVVAMQYVNEHGCQVFYGVQNLCSGLGYCVFWTGPDDGWVSGILSYGEGGVIAAHSSELKKLCDGYIKNFWRGCYNVEANWQQRPTPSESQPLKHGPWCWSNEYSCGAIENGCGIMLLQGDNGLWYDAMLRLEFNDVQQAWWAKVTLFEKKDCKSCNLQGVCSDCDKQEVLERATRVLCALQVEEAGKNKVAVRRQAVRYTASEGWQTQKSVSIKEIPREMLGFFEDVFYGQMINYFEQADAVSRVEL